MTEQRFALEYRTNPSAAVHPGLVLGDDGVVYAILPDGSKSPWGTGGTVGTVTSVAGKTGVVTLAASDIPGLPAQLASFVPASSVGVPSGVAQLDSSGKIPSSQLSAIAISNTYVVASQAAMLALPAHIGDVAVRTDLNQSFILSSNVPTVLANWQQLLTPGSPVQSVAGKTGSVTLVEADIANLVSDLAAINSAASSLTTTVNGKVSLSTVTTKGDLLVASGNGSVARIGVGSDGTALVADSTQATGVKWATVSGGGGGGGGSSQGVIRGVVGADGSIVAGSGFTITKVATGRYTINFTTPFGGVPSVIVTVTPTDSAAMAETGGVTVNAAGVTIFHLSGSLADEPFAFIAYDSAPAEITGHVNANGTIAGGTGFSCVRQAAGVYAVTYTTAFSVPPALMANAVAGASNGGGYEIGNSPAPSTTGFTMVTLDLSNTVVDREWYFLARAMH